MAANKSEMSFYKSEKGYQAITRWYDSLLDKFDFDHQSSYIETRFGRTHLIAAGPEDAEALILAQAVAGSALLWYHQIPYFSQHFKVYALDTPGQPGRSTAACQPWKPSLFLKQYTQPYMTNQNS